MQERVCQIAGIDLGPLYLVFSAGKYPYGRRVRGDASRRMITISITRKRRTTGKAHPYWLSRSTYFRNAQLSRPEDTMGVIVHKIRTHSPSFAHVCSFRR